MNEQTQQYTKDIEWWTANYKGRSLTLVMCNRIFGGRPGETMLQLQNYTVDQAKITFSFSREESLEVVLPASVELLPEPLPQVFVDRSIPEDKALVVRRCAQLRFTWYNYGESHTPENLCEEVYEYQLGSGTIRHESHLSWEKEATVERLQRNDKDEMLRISPYPDFRVLRTC